MNILHQYQQPHLTLTQRLFQTKPTSQKPPTVSLTTTMASSASKRLFKEYRGLSSDPPEGITAGPVSEDDMFLWEALIQGPEGTPFEGGVFPAELKFPKDYPLAPPTMRFLTGVWHPNGTYSLCFEGRSPRPGIYAGWNTREGGAS
jgi:hypothetical protein